MNFILKKLDRFANVNLNVKRTSFLSKVIDKKVRWNRDLEDANDEDEGADDEDRNARAFIFGISKWSVLKIFIVIIISF